MSNKNNVMGFALNDLEIADLERQCMEVLDPKATKVRQIVMACANPHSFAASVSDKLFEASLKDADHLICDGMGVHLASRLISEAPAPRITGHDYFHKLMNSAAKFEDKHARKLRVYFFGSSQHVLDKLTVNVNSSYGSVEIVGCFSPPFGDWNEAENINMISDINEASPDIVWVGMTAPKQETWVYRNRAAIKAPIIGSIGAVFDFVAGTYPRAPNWICKLGLEWLVRLLKEPKRMWRRTFVSVPLFLKETIKHRFT